MSWPRHVRWFVKYLGLLFAVVALGTVGSSLWLRHRVEHAQQQFDSITIDESWQGLPGYSVREVTPSRPGTTYWRTVWTPFLSTVWEVVVGTDGHVVSKHRYD